MKKTILILFIILLMVGCGKKEPSEKQVTEPYPIENPEPAYIDTNPIKVGLYNKGKLVKEYHNKFSDRKDIAVFEVVYSNLDDLGSTNLKNNWNKYYNEYSDIKDYKTGFFISFETGDQLHEVLIKDPSQTFALDPYLYYYLYDGVHATGRYTHLEMKDLKENTIYSTIKLYMHLKSKEITSPISLTVFTYKDDNDFKNGYYRGNSFYTVDIENK